MSLISGQEVKGFRGAIESLRAASRLNDPGNKGAVYESGRVKRWIEVAYFDGSMSSRSWRNLRFFAGFVQRHLKLNGEADKLPSVLGMESAKVLTSVSNLHHPIKADLFPRVRLLLHDADLRTLLLVICWMRKNTRRRIPSSDWVLYSEKIKTIYEIEINSEHEDLELMSAFLPDDLGKRVA